MAEQPLRGPAYVFLYSRYAATTTPIRCSPVIYLNSTLSRGVKRLLAMPQYSLWDYTGLPFDPNVSRPFAVVPAIKPSLSPHMQLLRCLSPLNLFHSRRICSRSVPRLQCLRNMSADKAASKAKPRRKPMVPRPSSRYSLLLVSVCVFSPRRNYMPKTVSIVL